MPPIWTQAVIARRAGVERHRVEYVLRSRGIQPATKVGCVCVYSEADAEYVISELRRIAAERGEAIDV